MSDVLNEEVQASAPTSIASNHLRALREQSGMHLAALAATLKVPPHRLEALEAGRYEELPNLTFARALATSVCRVLKVDAAPVLANLPQAQGVHIRESAEGINTPFPARGAVQGKAGTVRLLGLPRPVLLAVLTLLVAGVLWWWLPQQASQTDVPAPVTTAAPELALPPPAGVPVAVAEQPQAMPVSQQATPEPIAATPVVVESVPIAATPVVVESVSAPPVAPVAVLASATVPESVSGVEPLRVRARQSTWVQVKGASGRLLLQRTLQAGEEVGFASDLPLAVVVGHADAAEVLVRGNAFDQTPYVRNRVSRFEVR